MAEHIESRIRLDACLVERGLSPTRSRARDAIQRGHVRVEGRVETKASLAVDPGAAIAIDDPAQAYVSRAALKLKAGLDGFGANPAGRSALDVGASTGGFTQLLLERGAAHVLAIDVGHDQMNPVIAADPRVSCIEGLNAREMTREDLFGRSFDFLVADVSFISLTLALPPALELAEPGTEAVLLVKPQFEAGREAIGKGGLLRDPSQAETVAARLRDWLDAQPGWQALELIDSPILGGDGNREFLLHGRKAKSCT
ncbi:TlyA family RNA methyltransferase [Aurantimonas sp. 22II-16-19i]|uniref:TlyA family RNA methyltransferase n=1 Tax=Aurantimonas sp. 22II-16-19i TaxID=1317114 RepID=UPI0009F7C664|nr:TlyA family RNA methyltransferase [Aurantimonas sp. 22II-16-19i]ORE91448.1 putative rRNA methylase [Aurantimonas sp. 22II-16-19i]